MLKKKNKNVQSLKRKDTLGNISKMNTKGCVVVVFNHGTTNNTDRALDRRLCRVRIWPVYMYVRMNYLSNQYLDFIECYTTLNMCRIY